MPTAFSWLVRRRVLLVRHGNTGKAAVDAERVLTDKGERQCTNFKIKYADKLATVKHSFCSPVVRTATTALLVTGFDSKAVSDLYFGNIITDAHRTVDRDIGYAPAGDYLDKHAALYAEPAKRMATMLDDIGSAEVSGNGDVIIVGHALYLSLLTLEIIKALDGSTLSPESAVLGQQVVLQANVGEVEGFEISEDGVQFLTNDAVDEAPSTRAQCNDDFVIDNK
mmetsp:Transcript_51282/g.133192  ORF Transcript_51282/g.133192 Transcript_51282/m.133192 type:complete len:224 (+) Transcript_51282:3-674(+)